MKNLIKKTVLTLLIPGLLGLGIFFVTGSKLIPAVKAQDKGSTRESDKNLISKRCSANTIRGAYSYTAQGTILPGSPLPVPAGPFVSIGQVTLDGFGNITEHLTNDNFNGTILPTINYTGTYTVEENCSGTAVLVGRAPYKFTIADEGKEIYFMLDAPNTVVTGTARRQ